MTKTEFRAIYIQKLTERIERNSEEYSWMKDRVEIVVDKMLISMYTNVRGVMLEGAIANTLRACGVKKVNYTTAKEFINALTS